jgi:hypothetical protein
VPNDGGAAPPLKSTGRIVRTLAIDASDEEIRNLVVEWHELLAQRRYSEALELLPHSREEVDWTPELLDEAIQGYGVLGGDQETLDSLLKLRGVQRFEITTLVGRHDRDDIIARIGVDRENLYGLDPTGYIGMVHFDDVPLSGFRSDLTARFHIKRIGSDRLTLEFLDLHVM